MARPKADKQNKSAHALPAEERKAAGIERWMCGIMAKSGRWCKNPKVTGRTTCRMHGGKTPMGSDNPNYKTGATSKLATLRPELKRVADARRVDPNRLDLTNEMALISAVQEEAVEDWMSGGGGAAWLELKRLARLYRGEMAKKQNADVEVMRAAMVEILDLIDSNAARVAARDKVQEAIDNNRKVTESQRRHVVSMRTMMHTEEVLAAFGKIGEVIMREVMDPEARQRIIGTIYSVVVDGYKVDRPDVDEEGHIIESGLMHTG